MPELIDEYIVRRWKMPESFNEKDINIFIEEQIKQGWDFIDRYRYDGKELKFAKGVNEFAAD